MALVFRAAAAVAGWRRLVLDAPPANVMTHVMIGELRGLIAGLARDPDVTLLTLEGAGGHFSYGANVPEHPEASPDVMLPGFHDLIRELLAFPAPTAAIVRGRCVGSAFELALACDLIFAAEGALLGVPEVTLGVYPPIASALLPLRIGASKAALAVITGEVRPATAWHADGLVTAVFETDRLLGGVEEWSLTYIAPRLPAAVRQAAAASRAVMRAVALPAIAQLEAQYV